MIRKPLFKQTFSLLFIIGFSDFFANSLYLYWTVWWFDMVMHFSAGVCVGMAAVMAWQHFFDNNISLSKSIKIALISAFIIGVLWEVFELYFQVTTLSDGINYITDTSSDVILDVCGGLIGSLYAHKILNKK